MTDMKLSTKTFIADDSNDGFGVTSTLIMGKRDAILVDAQFTIANAHRLLAEIIESKKILKKILITHLHPDHYLGLEVIKEKYPEVEVYSYKEIADDINSAYDFKIDYWGSKTLKENGAKKKFNIKKQTDKVIQLEGEELVILGPMGGDCTEISPVWIPSISTLIASDVVFSDVHIWIADMRTQERINIWMNSLDRLEKLKPRVVIPGHAQKNSTFSPSAISFTRSYIQNFLKLLKTTKNSNELIGEVDRLYPGLPIRICLDYSAMILKDKIEWEGDWPESLRKLKPEL
ncbi:MBL fold metallo-hydrolase [Pantoea ananatis]|uniref:MBL fold metallo-hydrolase n=1 Tax=Pantoea ananas TaxID=553 RepID=UPI000FEC7B1F|nr:MBL fold metallo-hydrolase [Pantoea ananatis]QAB32601.1 MBL fold metallo-hydrolase [Pantoea ananatis]